MYIKIHYGQLGEVVAICDKELIGKRFEEGILQLEVHKEFYKGERKNRKYVKKIMMEASNLSLVGEKTIKLALEDGIIDEKNVIRIQGVPHAQCLK